MISIETINPEFIEFEGFYYLEYQGGFFKGCKRCGGEGHYSFNGEHSRCYACNNTSAKLGEYISDNRADAEKWCHGRALARANRLRKAEEKRMVEVRKMEAKQEALKVAAPDVYEFLMAVQLEDDNQYQYETYGDWARAQAGNTAKVEKNSFIRAMAESIRWVSQANKPFSEKMIEAVRNNIARRTQQEAEKAEHPVVTGRVEIQGEVVSTKSYETDYGTAYKMLVKDARGFKVFGSIPSNLWSEVEFLGAYKKLAWNETDGVMTKLVGMEVKFVATVEESRDDKSFGIFKRPAKAEIVA